MPNKPLKCKFPRLIKTSHCEKIQLSVFEIHISNFHFCKLPYTLRFHFLTIFFRGPENTLAGQENVCPLMTNNFQLSGFKIKNRRQLVAGDFFKSGEILSE